MENLPEDEVQGTEPEDTTVVPGATEPGLQGRRAFKEVQEEPEAEPVNPDPDAPGETPEPDPKPSSIDKRISKLVWEREEARRREAYWQGIAEGKGGPPQGAQPKATDGPPKQEQFESYDEYLRALTRHEIRTEMAQERQKLTEELEARELRGSFESRAQAVREKHSDFDEVVFNESLPISVPMRDAFMNSPDGAEMAYHLGQHPEEAARIARLSPYHQMLELGRISARIAAPPPAPQRPASAAPAPIKPIRGTDGTFQKDPERMTDAEWWKAQKRSNR